MMDAEILYLHAFPHGPPPPGSPAPATYPVMPVGIVALANLLRAEGHRIAGVNLPAARAAGAERSLEERLAGSPARLVLIDLHWYEHAAGVVDLAAEVRRLRPETRIVLGGLTATHFAREILALCPAVDAIVLGDAEEPVRALARAVLASEPWPPASVPNVAFRTRDGSIGETARTYRTSPEIIAGQDYVDLDFLAERDAYRRMVYSFPRRGLAPRGTGRSGQWLANGRGCAYRCSFCGGGRDAHREISGLTGLLVRPPESVAADVGRLVGQGVHQVALSLDPDMLGRAHCRAFLDALARRDARPGLYIESYQLPSETLLDGVSRIAHPDDTEFAITPLSGNEATRKRNGKFYSSDDLLRALDALARRDLSVSIFFSLNLPGEDDRTIQETVALAERILSAFPVERLRLIDIAHTLDPASPMLRAPSVFGIERVTLRSFADYVAYGRRLGAAGPAVLDEASRGFVIPGRNLPEMAAAWDALAARHPGVVVPVPRVG